MPETRIIKRYANRKLYDTEHSRYVTLDQISEMIRNGDDVKIVDNKTKEDLTTVTLAQIIFEEEKKQRSFLPLGAMRNIIQSGGEWFAEAQRRVQSILPGKRKDGRRRREGRRRPTAPDEPAARRVPPTRRRAARSAASPSLREWVDHSQAAGSTSGRSRSTARSAARSTASRRRSRRGRASTRTCKTLADRIAELEAKLRELEAHEEPHASSRAEEPRAEQPRAETRALLQVFVERRRSRRPSRSP